MSLFGWLFRGDLANFNGVSRFNVYFMRVIYGLMFFVLGADVWSHILSHEGQWDASDAMDWSVWAAFSLIAFVGLFRTVEMIPVLLVEILYKVIWLALVAVPAWLVGDNISDKTDGMLLPFMMVILPILAVPWSFVFTQYLKVGNTPRSLR